MGEISPTLAAILYGASCRGIWDRYTCQDDRGKACLHNLNALPDGAYSKAFSLQENCAVSFVRGIMGKSMGILKTQVENLRFLYCHNHPGCGILDGNKECSIEMVGSAVIRLQTQLSDLLQSKLLFRFHASHSFWNMWDRLEERISNASVGLNFMSLSHNQKFCVDNYLSFLSHMKGHSKRFA